MLGFQLRWQKMISPSNWPFKKKSLHLNDNMRFCSIIQSSKLFLGSLLAKNNFFVQFWIKNFASSRMANCGSGLPAEWPFRSQNAIEASDSPLPGGLWVKRLITHALCSPAYSDIAWCKLFMIFTMKCLFGVFFVLFWILLMWKPFEILMIFELFPDQILWRARNKWKFLTFYPKCAISRKILEVSKIWMTVFW